MHLQMRSKSILRGAAGNQNVSDNSPLMRRRSSEQLTNHASEPGNHIIPFQRLFRGEIDGGDARALDGDRMGTRIDHPDHKRAGAEIIGDLLLHLLESVAGGNDFDSEIGSSIPILDGPTRRGNAGCADEANIDAADNIWIAGEKETCL